MKLTKSQLKQIIKEELKESIQPPRELANMLGGMNIRSPFFKYAKEAAEHVHKLNKMLAALPPARLDSGTTAAMRSGILRDLDKQKKVLTAFRKSYFAVERNLRKKALQKASRKALAKTALKLVGKTLGPLGAGLSLIEIADAAADYYYDNYGGEKLNPDDEVLDIDQQRAAFRKSAGLQEITKSQLKQIIKEEMEAVLTERPIDLDLFTVAGRRARRAERERMSDERRATELASQQSSGEADMERAMRNVKSDRPLVPRGEDRQPLGIVAAEPTLSGGFTQDEVHNLARELQAEDGINTPDMHYVAYLKTAKDILMGHPDGRGHRVAPAGPFL